MDIAKYVGLFLIKNEYCFLPGIGSLEIAKKPAVYDKETQKMSAPLYEVKYRQVGGSIDDSFANFIANNERISIAHASNHLKDFCAHAKADLRENRDVVIPAIGKFVAGQGNSIQFVTEPQLHIEGKAIPFFKNSVTVEKKNEEALSNIIERTNIREPKADEEIEYKAPSVNWGKIIILSAIVLVVIVGVVYLIWSMGNKDGKATKEVVDTTVTETPAEQPQAPVVADTTAVQPAATATTANGLTVNTDGTISYKVGLQQYAAADKAEGRVAKLKSYGNAVELWAKDSANYYVVMTMTSAPTDTVRVVDSLKRLFNPSGKVEIVR